MANGHGGYRKPAHPAPTSGPGAHSRRTDGQPIADLPNSDYGENKAFREIQSGAPRAGGTSSAAPQQQSAPVQMPTGLNAPSMQPGTPVTAGAEYGAGPGPDALGLVNGDKADAQDFAHRRSVLIWIAQQDSTPTSTKRAIRQLLADS